MECRVRGSVGGEGEAARSRGRRDGQGRCRACRTCWLCGCGDEACLGDVEAGVVVLLGKVGEVAVVDGWASSSMGMREAG